jgi:hypothetical protein
METKASFLTGLDRRSSTTSIPKKERNQIQVTIVIKNIKKPSDNL